MKHFVKIISALIVFIMTVTSIVALIFFGECIAYKYRLLQSLPHSVSEGFGVISDILTPPAAKIFIVLVGLAMIVLIIESIMLIRAYIKAIKSESYERYQDFSVMGFVEILINIAIFWYVKSMVNNGIPDETLEVEITRLLLVCLAILICTIYDMLVTRNWIMNEPCDRIVTVSGCIFIFVGGLGSVIFFINGRPLGGIINLCICILAIVILAVRIMREKKGL